MNTIVTAILPEYNKLEVFICDKALANVSCSQQSDGYLMMNEARIQNEMFNLKGSSPPAAS